MLPTTVTEGPPDLGDRPDRCGHQVTTSARGPRRAGQGTSDGRRSHDPVSGAEGVDEGGGAARRPRPGRLGGSRVDETYRSEAVGRARDRDDAEVVAPSSAWARGAATRTGALHLVDVSGAVAQVEHKRVSRALPRSTAPGQAKHQRQGAGLVNE